MHFILAVQCSSLPVTNSLYMASHKAGTIGKYDENGLYSQCVFSASINVIDTQIQTPFSSHTLSSVRSDGCYMHRWNASSDEQHSEISPLKKPLPSSDSGDRNPVGWMLDIRTSCQSLHRPSVPCPVTNKLACSYSQDHTLLLWTWGTLYGLTYII